MLTPTQDRKTRSTIDTGERFQMGIDADAVGLVIENLAGLYSDQLTAMLREYATNGIDATIAAGRKTPIDVTLPTHMKPTLTIRDYGIGLTGDDLRLIYSQFGASTKRDSNDFNGTLGFGCKSALAYVDTFNIASVKDGVKVYAMVTKTDDLPEFHVMRTAPAPGEPDGTTVEIPVTDQRDQRAMIEKANYLYSFFDRGTVKVNGREVPQFTYDIKVDDTLWIIKGDSYYDRDKPSIVIMGNVPYPAPVDHGLANGYRIVVKVPIGAVEFTPSREGLKLNKPATKNTLAAIQTRLRKHFRTAVQRDVNLATTPQAAMLAIRKWRGALKPETMPKDGTLTWKGQTVPDKFSAGPEVLDSDGSMDRAATPHFVVVHYHSRTLKDHSRVRALDAESVIGDDVLWVENFDQAAFSPTVKKKLNKLHAQRNLSADEYILCPGKVPSAFWTDGAAIVDYAADVKPIKLDRVQTSAYGGSTRPTGSYDAYVNGGSSEHIQAGDIDTTKPLLYVHGNMHTAKRWRKAVALAFPTHTFIYMGENRIAKFQRDFPQAKRVDRAIQDHFATVVKSIDQDDLKALALSDMHGMGAALRALDGENVQDPAILKAIRLSKRDITKLKELRDQFRYLSNVTFPQAKMENPFKPYPLVNVSPYGSPNLKPLGHAVLYLNSVYAARQAGTL